MLEIRSLHKTFSGPHGRIIALDDVSLRLAEGEFVAVRGPSGSGKTTLLFAAGGLLQPDSGQVIMDGRDLYQLSREARAGFRADKVGFVFQQFHLVPYLSVWENVLTPSLASPIPNAQERARDLIGRFGLGQRLHHRPAELSTGERQRTALARALLSGPRLLLADEPTGNLDLDSGKTVLSHLSEFARAGGAVLLVTHDVRAAEFAQRTILLEPALATAGAGGSP